ncbi:cytochrome C assembly family protein [Steroidobacter denitrificans]|uniref:cytochrome C assembly family protein n=1 Tax=Steroidobacter denitrificans TaxID=465721 RepID=UPI00082FDF27|nr:cytochrome c biogenesis protein CcsA [Steroidobacter denitrificans]
MLSIVVLACYLACAAWLVSSAFHPDAPRAGGRRVAGLALGATALILHAVLLRQGLFAKPAISFTTTETASLIGWPMGLIALVLSWLRPRFASIGAVLMAVTGVVAMATTEGSGGYALTRQNWEIAAHIALSTVAYALIMIAAVLAVTLALLDRRLRHRRPLGWLRAVPSLEALEGGTFQALGAGFAVLTLALFSGFIFVSDLFAQHLFHKTVLSCVAWIIFAVVLFGRWRFGWRGRVATSWTLGGFALLGLAYFGSKIVLESILGRHWT